MRTIQRVFSRAMLFGIAGTLLADATVHVPGCGFLNGPTCAAGDAEYYAIHEGQDSSCDFGLKASNGKCVNDTRMTLNPVGGWLGWSMREQRYQISGNIPVNFVPTLGTHNSYSSAENGVWNYLQVDQTLSIWDQLQAGARYIRLDPAYYQYQLHVCHGSAGSCPLGSDGRLYSYALGEVVDWLNANPGEFVLLDIHADTNSTGAHNDLLWEPLKTYLGLARIYTYRNYTDAGSPNTLPSIQQMIQMGKQVMILSTQVIAADGGEQVTFDRAKSYTETMSVNGLTWYNCQADDASYLWPSATKFAYASEDRSSSVVVDLQSNYGYLNAAEVSRATQCGYGIIAIDQFLNLAATYPLFSFQSITPAPTTSGPDTRREASVWSFGQNDYGTKGPALIMPTSHWTSDVNTATHYYACASSTADTVAWPARRNWRSSNNPTTYNAALSSAECPAGFVFSAPVNGAENSDLIADVYPFPATGLWLKYVSTAASVVNSSPSQVTLTVPYGANPADLQQYATTLQMTGLPNQTISLYPGLIPVSITPSTLTLDANGSGSFTIAPAAGAVSKTPGTYPSTLTWIAAYGGVGGMKVTLVVQVPTQMVLSATPNTTMKEGQSFTLYSKLGASGPGAVATGTTTFRSLDYSNSVTVLAQPDIQSDGTNTVNVQLGPGTYQLTAAYSGDATHAPSSSEPLSVTVLPNVTPSPTSYSLRYQIGAQNNALQSLTVTHVNNTSMQLTAQTACFDQPDGAACWLAAGPVPGGIATSFTVPLNYTAAVTNLPVGVYRASVALNDSVDGIVQVPVTLNVSGNLTLTPPTLNFFVPYYATSVDGQTVVGTVGTLPVELVLAGQSANWMAYQNGTVVILPNMLPKQSGGLPSAPGTTFSGSINFSTPYSSTSQKVYVNVQIVQPATIDTLPSGEPITVDGAPFVSPQTFNWGLGTNHTISVPTPIINGVDQLTFGSWSDQGAQTHTIVTPKGAAATWTAMLNTLYPSSASVTPQGSGTVVVNPPPVNGYYGAGTQVTVIATANQGFTFTGFSGSASGQTSPAVFTVSGPFSVTANFTPIGGPKMYAIPGAVTLTPTVGQPNLASVALTLKNIGAGAAVDATIKSITGITAASGSGLVQCLSPAIDVGTILSNTTASSAVVFDWPPSATRVRFTVNFGDGSGYTGSTTLTLIR